MMHFAMHEASVRAYHITCSCTLKRCLIIISTSSNPLKALTQKHSEPAIRNIIATMEAYGTLVQHDSSKQQSLTIERARMCQIDGFRIPSLLGLDVYSLLIN